MDNYLTINTFKRPAIVPDYGYPCDLLWADPYKDVDYFGANERGVSFSFGKKALNEFLDRNNLDLVCRAHQVVEDGYEFFANRRLVTVFSAPNYCNEFDNSAGLMSIDENLVCSFQVIPFIIKYQFL